MSWISDVKDEIKNLELSKKKLRSFGLLVGGVFLLISFWLLFSHKDGSVNANNHLFTYVLLLFGGILFLTGVFFPSFLKNPYKIWMGIAFFIGWIVSRILIAILFYVVVTPLGIVAKLFGKEFLDVKFRDNKNSYWVMKSPNKQIDYRKMF